MIFPPHETDARSPRGGPTRGRSAEWRPELVELADDSASSTDATIPPSSRGARSMTGSTEALLYVSNVQRRWAWVRECKTSHRTASNHTRIGADPGDTEERRATKPRAARLGRAPQDHRGVLSMRTRRHVPKGRKKRELREAKRTSDRKNIIRLACHC